MSYRNKKVFLTHVDGQEKAVRVDGTEVRKPKPGETDKRVCLYDPSTDRRIGWVPVSRLSEGDRQRIGA